MVEDIQVAYLGFFSTTENEDNESNAAAENTKHMKVNTTAKYQGKCWVFPALKTKTVHGEVSCGTELNAGIALHLWYAVLRNHLWNTTHA